VAEPSADRTIVDRLRLISLGSSLHHHSISSRSMQEGDSVNRAPMTVAASP
jgi:hypothetical protein